jgi:ABC-2 type transport system permease protein
MNTRRTLAISRRIAEMFRRDHRTLALMFLAPLVIMALLGWVLRDAGPTSTSVAVVNELGSIGTPVSEGLASALSDGGMNVKLDIADEATARQALRDGSIDVVIVLAAGGSSNPSAGLANLSITIITPGLSPADDADRIGALRDALASSVGQLGPTISQETIYGNGNFFDAFTPALIGFVVFFLVFILTGISFLRERVGGTLERLLATPVRRLEIVVGYSVGFGLFALVQVALVMLFVLGTIHIDAIGPLPEVNFGLGVPSAGSPWLAFLITLLLAISAVNLGIFLSTFARTEFQILQFIPLVIVPQGVLSGIFWPVDALPGVLQPIAWLMPMTYGIDGLREVLVKGSGLDVWQVQLDLLVLAGIALLLAALASLTIRREIV